MLGNIAEKEAIIVNGEPITRPTVAVPNDLDSMLLMTAGSARAGDDLVFMLSEDHFGSVQGPLALCRLAVDDDGLILGRQPQDLDFQAFVGLSAVSPVENRSMDRLQDGRARRIRQQASCGKCCCSGGHP